MFLFIIREFKILNFVRKYVCMCICVCERECVYVCVSVCVCHSWDDTPEYVLKNYL